MNSVFSVNIVFVIYKRSLARLSLMIFCWRFFEIYRNFFLLYFLRKLVYLKDVFFLSERFGCRRNS